MKTRPLLRAIGATVIVGIALASCNSPDSSFAARCQANAECSAAKASFDREQEVIDRIANQISGGDLASFSLLQQELTSAYADGISSPMAPEYLQPGSIVCESEAALARWDSNGTQMDGCWPGPDGVKVEVVQRKPAVAKKPNMPAMPGYGRAQIKSPDTKAVGWTLTGFLTNFPELQP